MKFGISEAHFETLNDLAVKPLQKLGCHVWIFGSRATGKYKEFSDIDLMYESSKDLDLSAVYQIKAALQDSDLPYKVDLVNRKDLAASYKAEIEASKIKL